MHKPYIPGGVVPERLAEQPRGDRQDWVPTGSFAQKTTDHCSLQKKISEIKFKPAEEQNQQSSNGLQAVQKRIHSSLPAGQKRALCSCLPNSGMTPLCQCFPFSYKACPGIPRAGRVREPSRAPGQGLTRLGAKRNNRLGNEAPSCFSMCRQQNANIFQAGLYRVAHGRTKGPGEDGQRRPTMRLVAK